MCELRKRLGRRKLSKHFIYRVTYPILTESLKPICLLTPRNPIKCCTYIYDSESEYIFIYVWFGFVSMLDIVERRFIFGFNSQQIGLKVHLPSRLKRISITYWLAGWWLVVVGLPDRLTDSEWPGTAVKPGSSIYFHLSSAEWNILNLVEQRARPEIYGSIVLFCHFANMYVLDSEITTKYKHAENCYVVFTRLEAASDESVQARAFQMVVLNVCEYSEWYHFNRFTKARKTVSINCHLLGQQHRRTTSRLASEWEDPYFSFSSYNIMYLRRMSENYWSRYESEPRGCWSALCSNQMQTHFIYWFDPIYLERCHKSCSYH